MPIQKINSFSIQVIKKSVLIIVALLLISILVQKEGWFWGFLFGWIASAVSFIALSYKVEQQVQYGSFLGFGNRFSWLLGRFGVLALALVLAIKISWISLPASAIALFIPQLAIFLTLLLPEKQPEKDY